MSEEKYKDRKWRILLYPEDSSHVAAMQKLAEGGYKYIAILHNKDVEEDGTPKKEHWHVVVKFPAARYNTALAKELGIAVNYIKDCKDFDSAVLYLIHHNHEEKAQYDVDETFGTLVPHLNKLLEDDCEDVRVLQIVHLIDSSPGRCTYREILVKCCNNGLYGEFRRLGSGIKWLIDEHNDEVENEYVRQYGERYPKERFERFVEMTGAKNIIPL